MIGRAVMAAATVAAAMAACVSHSEEFNVTCRPDTRLARFGAPDTCSGDYWECRRGCGRRRQCWGFPDRMFDRARGRCGYRQYVDCGSHPCPNKTCISDAKTDGPSDNFTCPSDDGHFPDDQDCAQFYKCADGVPARKRCPLGDDGEQWLFQSSSRRKPCQEAAKVKCGDRPVCDETGEECGPQPDACTGVVCGEDEDAFHHPAKPCQECACKCCSGRATLVCCPHRYFWDAEIDVCAKKSTIPTCWG